MAADQASAPDTIRDGAARPPKYRVHIIQRQASVMVYDELHPLNYVASCQVFIYGDVGMMYTINGQGFYDAFTQPGTLVDLFRRLEIRTLEGYVTPAHARLMRIALRAVASVEDVHRGMMAGHPMTWIRIQPLEP